MSSVFVINESVSSCCGQPTGKCTCRGRQHVHNVVPAHEPLCLNQNWDFEMPDKHKRVAPQPKLVDNRSIDEKSVGLGLNQSWDFEPVHKR